jgi:MFS family permease
MPQLIVFRFLAGCAGAAPVTLGGATIADVTIQEKRGFAMSLFSLGPLIGPVIGPVGGSFLAAAEGWRWTFWLITIVYGTCTIAHVLLCRETFSVVLLARKTQKLRTATGNQNLRSAQDDGLTPAVRMQRAMVRPLKMLMFSPIVFAMAIYIAFLYGVLYLLYTTFTFVFTQSYGFSSSTVGLVYIGNGIGNLIGLMTFAFLSDRLLTRKASAGDGELKPEYRLIIVMYLGWLAPAGLFIYGWTAYYEVHWVVPIFGTLLFGLAIIAALISVQVCMSL